MKYFIATIFFLSSITLPTLAEEAKQTLVVEAPETWQVEFQGDKGIEFYTVTRKEGDDTALLMFSQWPAPGNVKRIPEYIESMAENFLKIAKRNKDLNLKADDYKIEEIEGEVYTGSFVQFDLEEGITQTMFMIGDEAGIWNGQFTGTKEQWMEAIMIIKKLKK